MAECYRIDQIQTQFCRLNGTFPSVIAVQTLGLRRLMVSCGGRGKEIPGSAGPKGEGHTHPRSVESHFLPASCCREIIALICDTWDPE